MDWNEIQNFLSNIVLSFLFICQKFKIFDKFLDLFNLFNLFTIFP